MDAVITPHRSLSARGFGVLMTMLIAINVVIGAVFLNIGAIPVPIFLGADVLAVWFAFRVSYRSALMTERVQVTAAEVRVLRERGRMRATVWRSPTAFTRVDVEEPGEHEARVRLRLSDRRWTVAAALSPPERETFAAALRQALRAAMSERW